MGKKNGQGKIKFADGSSYEGGFEMNDINGSGRYVNI